MGVLNRDPGINVRLNIDSFGVVFVHQLGGLTITDGYLFDLANHADKENRILNGLPPGIAAILRTTRPRDFLSTWEILLVLDPSLARFNRDWQQLGRDMQRVIDRFQPNVIARKK